jgi:hypothetical protein
VSRRADGFEGVQRKALMLNMQRPRHLTPLDMTLIKAIAKKKKRTTIMFSVVVARSYAGE